MSERTYWPFSIAYTLLGAIALVVAVSWADFTADLWVIVPLAVVAVWMDDWPYRLADKLTLALSSAVVMVAVVLAPPTTAPFVGSAVLAFTALGGERTDFKADRLFANVGQLAIIGFLMGVAFEAIQPEVVGPSLRLFAAIVLANLVDVILGLAFVIPALWYRYGRSSTTGLPRQLRLLTQSSPVVYAAGLLASVVAVVGRGWLVFALLQVLVIAYYPVARARLDVKRARLITTMTQALDGRGLVDTRHARMEGLALHIGRSFGLSESRLQQLRYVTLTYSMTDLFAGQLARPMDLPADRGFGGGAFSRMLFTGLILDDIADEEVQAIAEAVARYDGLIDPLDGEVPLLHAAAIVELTFAGVEPRLIAALDVAAGEGAADLGVLRRQLESGYPPGGPERRPRQH